MQSQEYNEQKNNIKEYDVLVIGAGPSGMMAAICAANGGKRVIVIEQKDIPGKKIYATGNGRCNYTNMYFDDKVYRGNDTRFAYDAFKKFDNHALIAFMNSIGVVSRDIQGYVYPANEQARTVADALAFECRRLGVTIRCSDKAVDIIEKNNCFEIKTDNDSYNAKKVIIAVGGKASPTHGSDGNLNRIIRALGHEIIRQNPALVPLTFEDKKLSELAGVRFKCRVTLHTEPNEEFTESGEVIINKDNISGIPVMQLSRYAVNAMEKKEKPYLELDLCTDTEQDELCKLIQTSVERKLSVCEALSLIVNRKIAEYFTELTQNTERLAEMLKHFRIDINGDCSFNRAQVSSGGVDVGQLTPNMESRLVNGLYFVGEIIDVDGTCGGYNLQWAFTSGYIAGSHCATLSS